MTLDPVAMAALAAAAVLLLMILTLRQRQRGGAARRRARLDSLDTVLAWRPEATRVLTAPEIQAMDLLRRAAPGFLVLAQVPLSRFLRVPTRNSYTDWLARVGNLNADLLLCDSSSRVLAVIDVRAPQESERSRRRHERMIRVLDSAAIPVHVWRQGSIPTIADVRAQIGPLLSGAEVGQATATPSRPPTTSSMPLLPVPDITELLTEGDLAAARAQFMEPVPSGFFDDLDLGGAHPAR